MKNPSYFSGVFYLKTIPILLYLSYEFSQIETGVNFTLSNPGRSWFTANLASEILNDLEDMQFVPVPALKHSGKALGDDK